MLSPIRFSLLLAIICAIFITIIAAQLQFRKASHDGACGVKASDLGKHEHEVEPTHYDLSLNLNLALTKFEGLVEIDLNIEGRSEERANEIWLNADDSIDIRSIKYQISESTGLRLSSWKSSTKYVDVLEACLNTKHQVLVLTLADELQAGSRGKLSISYEGQYGKFGLAKKSYLSQLIGSDAIVMFNSKSNGTRRLLPCFDDHHFKSTFKLRVRRFPHLKTFSNTDKKFDLYDKRDEFKVIGFDQTEPIRVDELKLEMRA